MRPVLFLMLLLLAAPAFGQGFPSSFLGHWEGELHWYPLGAKEPRKSRMQLLVKPADTAGQYTWGIIYGAKGEDNRPYLLKPLDTAKGHWIIDEENGIRLDQFWIGNRFTGSFTVQGASILNTYYREGDSLIVEFYSTAAKPLRTSGHGTEASPHVDSYTTRSYQRAVLRRK